MMRSMHSWINKQPKETVNHELSAIESRALEFILPLSPEYPQINLWFRNKVVPGLQGGSRKLLVVERHGQIVALGIGKIEGGENKICTVRVAPEYYGRGMGVRIFDDLMSWMGDDKPLATVSENKLPQFRRIFDHFGYELTSVHNGRYLPRTAEYLFNEKLRLGAF